MRNIIFIIFFLNYLTVDAQLFNKVDELLQSHKDSIYIEDFGQSMLIKPIVAYRNFHYLVTKPDCFKTFFAFNSVLYGGVGGAYRNVQLQLLFPVKSISSFSGFGQVGSTDINLNLVTNKLNGTAYYKKYTGVWAYDKEADTSAYIRDAELLKVGVHGFFSFNSHYSPNAAFKQSLRQKKSVSSFLLGFDSFFFHNSYPDSESETVQYSNVGKLYNISLMPGYAYTLVIVPKVFITCYAFAGAGIQFPDDFASSLISTHFSYIYSVKASAGYNGDKWIIGLIYEHINNILPQDNFVFTANSNYYKFNIAYRIKF